MEVGAENEVTRENLDAEWGGRRVRIACNSAPADKIAAALATLLEAYRYACDTSSDRWDFAVPIREFGQLGLTVTDFRWLARKGLVDHAREVTRFGNDGRDFRPTGDLTFCPRSCLVLTDSGVAEAIRMEAASRTRDADPGDLASATESDALLVGRIRWDAATRYLTVDDRLVKWFRSPAPNQERILAAFEEEAWPSRVDDPLPPHEEQDPKRRLSDTIKCLNRKQLNQLIRFHGDGRGEGIVWDLRPSAGIVEGPFASRSPSPQREILGRITGRVGTESSP